MRDNNKPLDDLLDQPFPVLDRGFVRLVDYMGTEASIVRAARVSYGKGTKQSREDAQLIRYLYSHDHTTPFEMVEFVFHVKCPMDTWRQWIRQRTASVNEYSTRYSEAVDDMAQTAPDQWRKQSKLNKQGSEEGKIDWPEGFDAKFGKIDGLPGQWLSAREHELQKLAKEVYQERLDFGVAKEQARKDLPLSNYTEAYWKIDLHNLLRFLSQRMDSHAQLEIRQYATVIARFVELGFPNVWQAHLDFDMRKNAVRFSADEQRILAQLLDPSVSSTVDEAEELLGKRGSREFYEKLNRIVNSNS